jgi:hypothetical protein
MALSDVVIAYFKAPYKLLIKNQLHLYIYTYIPLYVSLRMCLNEQKHVGDNKLQRIEHVTSSNCIGWFLINTKTNTPTVYNITTIQAFD